MTGLMWRRCASCRHYDQKALRCTYKGLELEPGEGKWCSIHETESEWRYSEGRWPDLPGE